MKHFALILLLSFSVTHATSRLHFNKQGDIVKPDFEQVRLGLKDSKNGHLDSAMAHYKKAARFGNYYAMTLIAVEYIKQKDYVHAKAWLDLIDLNRTQQRDVITDTLNLLEQKLTSAELFESTKIHQNLLQKYSHEATFEYRESWREGLQFTGTKTRGRIPQNLTIVLEAEGNIEKTSKMTVTGHEIRAQLEKYVHEYDFDVPFGEVRLPPVEIIEN